MAASSPPSAVSLWGDKRFSDATIVMGQKVWHVHRWVICQQSTYFAKALEGDFMESKTSTINLTGSPFLEEQVDGLLKYLYFNALENRQKKDPIATFMVADYFQVASLRTNAADELGTSLQSLTQKKWFVGFKEICHIVLGQHAGTHLEQTVVKIIADNIQMVMHESGAWVEMTDAYPGLAKKVLEVIYPKPVLAGPVKRSAGAAFDDTLLRARANKILSSRNPNYPY
ncbi:hypothetical protein INS49_004891 [Diaporthe citri]|uniref:uncharacterized protein n=1 Tax=Diaporthe citri TaxID=83186 RepID=UPI001C8223D4|nr:uncharacterized protein INS49_004891 [Diaporthe citri]KAG6354286.1 hypothetical protein INS49_004891 [Diaporthe citri]